jgi:hypothetical protein
VVAEGLLIYRSTCGFALCRCSPCSAPSRDSALWSWAQVLAGQPLLPRFDSQPMSCRTAWLGRGLEEYADHLPTNCRFTGELAKMAKSVFALDFMHNLIEQNRANNEHLGNISFK